MPPAPRSGATRVRCTRVSDRCGGPLCRCLAIGDLALQTRSSRCGRCALGAACGSCCSLAAGELRAGARSDDATSTWRTRIRSRSSPCARARHADGSAGIARARSSRRRRTTRSHASAPSRRTWPLRVYCAERYRRRAGRSRRRRDDDGIHAGGLREGARTEWSESRCGGGVSLCLTSMAERGTDV